MKRIFISLLSIFILSVLFSNIAFAQVDTTAPPKGTIVATVNITNAKIISNNDRDYKISFDISNRVGAQPEIKYSVRLTKSSSTSETLFDEKVYDEVLSLGENTSINKTIEYSVPASIPIGTYKLWVDSKNENGLMLGIALIDEVKVTKNVPNTIQIITDSCYLMLGTSTERFLLTQGVSIGPKDILTLKCEVQSSFSTNVIFTPNFITRNHTAFGNTVPTIGGTKENITIKNGNNNVAPTLPKASKPQDYNLTFSLSTLDTKTTSNLISINYVLSGQAGTIQNVVFDKTYYTAGETADLQIFSTQTAIGTSTVAVIISDNTGTCSATSTEEISNFSIINLKIPITKDCTNPKANITLSAGNNVLDSKDFKVATIISTSTPVITTTKIVLSFVFLILALIVGIIIYEKKHSTL